jgi:hypothetical protein
VILPKEITRQFYVRKIYLTSVREIFQLAKRSANKETKKVATISPDNQPVAILHEQQPRRIWRGQEGSADRSAGADVGPPNFAVGID